MSKTKGLLLAAGIVLAMAFTFIACDSGGGGSGGGGGDTYTGTANGVAYTLQIEGGGYTLTSNGKTSTGVVSSSVGGVLTLAPSSPGAQAFTATVSGNGITAMAGTITYNNGSKETAPATLTPSGGGSSSSNGGGTPSGLVGVWKSDVFAQGGADWLIEFKSDGGFETNGVGFYTYTTSGNVITIKSTLANETFTATYSISGNKLTLTSSDVPFPHGAYTRQSSTTPGGSSSSVGVQGSSCPDPVVLGNSVTCGGQTYRTVQIGEQVWFAENLNYNVSGSKCYGNDPANCAKYGRLYDWETAMSVCPEGWHLPTQGDWEVMTAHIGGASTEGKNLKATSGWNNNGNGTDQYGFSALPGGDGGSAGGFYDVGDLGYWWSASESNSSSAYRRRMYYDLEYANWDGYFKSRLSSVRCLQD